MTACAKARAGLAEAASALKRTGTVVASSFRVEMAFPVLSEPIPPMGEPRAVPNPPTPVHHERTTGAVTVECICDPTQLAAYEAPWKALERSVEHSHLSTFDFIVSWYLHYGGDYGGTPLPCLAWRDRSLVAVAPFAICRGRIGGVPVRRIELAPTDVPAGEFLMADDDPEVISAVIDTLIDGLSFDVMSLEGFAPESPALDAVERVAAKRRLLVERIGHAYAIADVSHGYARYYAQLSGHFRRNLKHRARKIAEAGGAAVTGIEFIGDKAERNACVSRIIAITEASYKLQGARLADCHRAFLSDVIARLSASGTLCLPILTIGGRDAAFILGVIDRGVFYDITLSYDEAFAKLSPGSCLMQKMLERLASLGVHTVVSFGAHEYKKHWATRFVPQTRLLLFNRGFRARAARFSRLSAAPIWQRIAGPRIETS